jgi:NAD(P)H-dependent FMN reductase
MDRLVVLTVSTRPGRIGPKIANWFTEVARQHGGFEVCPVDLSDMNLPLLDEPIHPMEREYQHEHTRRWSSIIDQADALALVMPEYNYSFSAPLKNALDFLYHEWAYLAVGFVSYGGQSAGLRAVEAVKPVLTRLQMVPAASAVAIHFRQRIDAEGVLHPDENMTESAVDLLDELLPLTAAMRQLRRPAVVDA